MAKFLIKASYSESGMKSVLSAGAESRRDYLAGLIGGLGGTLEAFYFAFGDVDVYLIADLPDNVTAAALGTTVGASGVVSRYETVVLLTPAEIDAAAKIKVDYRAPG